MNRTSSINPAAPPAAGAGPVARPHAAAPASIFGAPGYAKQALGETTVQKLRTFIVPGLFLLHLLTLCGMILYAPVLAEHLKADRVSSIFRLIMLSQLFLTALWAGWGPEPSGCRDVGFCGTCLFSIGGCVFRAQLSPLFCVVCRQATC